MTVPEVWWSPTVPGVFVKGKFGTFTRHGWRSQLDDLPADAVRLVPATDGMTAGLFRALAAGRREYADRLGDSDDPRQTEIQAGLLAEAATWDLAALIVSGDVGPLYDLLPSWRWTEEMHERVLKGTSRATTAADVTALARHTETPEG